MKHILCFIEDGVLPEPVWNVSPVTFAFSTQISAGGTVSLINKGTWKNETVKSGTFLILILKRQTDLKSQSWEIELNPLLDVFCMQGTSGTRTSIVVYGGAPKTVKTRNVKMSALVSINTNMVDMHRALFFTQSVSLFLFLSHTHINARTHTHTERERDLWREFIPL